MLAAAGNAFAQGIGSITPPRTAQSPDAGDQRGRGSPTPDYRQYEYGKEIYAVKLGCSSCPLGDKVLDDVIARRFLADQSLWNDLNEKEHEAVMVFLKQRFAL